MQGKKFQFFDVDMDTGFDNEGNLNNVSPYQMFAVNQIIFLSAKRKKQVNHTILNEQLVLKIVKNEIVDEYELFNKITHFFEVKQFEGKHYFVCCGLDFNSKDMFFLSSVKIFDATRLLDRNYKVKDRKIDEFLIKQVNLLRNIEDNSLYLGKDFPKNVETIQNIISFAISEDMSHCALGLDRGQIVLIKSNPNLIEVPDRSIKMRYLFPIETELYITNLAFAKFYFIKENIIILYATTTQSIYFYKIFDRSEELYSLNQDFGAYSGCIDVKSDKLIVGTSTDSQITEYYNLEMGPSQLFEGKKRFTKYFKDYITFVIIHDDKSPVLAIYDRINKFFSYCNSTYTKVSCICDDGEFLYAFVEIDYTLKQIIKLKEKDNKYKFEIFYKRSFYDTAYEYAKNLNYDKKKISEINRRHGDHIYSKGDYAKAIEQYIFTINYLDPSYVIQKFLDGSKLNYLINYLEVLHRDDGFKSRSSDEMKDYTALLLNCYIKLKQIDKLKLFVDSKDISTQVINVETAIEVCKDTDQIDLALSIAEKAKLDDIYVGLMIDYKSKYYNPYRKL